MGNKNLQNGVSVTCDFKENTWTFEMKEGFVVCAGEYAIIPADKFRELLKGFKEYAETKKPDNLIYTLKDIVEN